MSKKEFKFKPGGIVAPDLQAVAHSDEVVLSKKDQDKLAEILKGEFGNETENIHISAQFKPDAIKKLIGLHVQTPAVCSSRDKRKYPMEQNYAPMAFLEDIIYCPTQIDYYFRTPRDRVFCLYIRQRHGDTTAELVPCEDSGEFIYGDWLQLELSREYDIEGCGHKSREDEESEIIAIEKECINKLREIFPEINFPEKTRRITHRFGEGSIESFIDTKQS